MDKYVPTVKNVTVDLPMIGSESAFIDPVAESIVRGARGGISDMVFVSSQMGTQKTGLLSKIIDKASSELNRAISVLCISPRLSLSMNQQMRFNSSIKVGDSLLEVINAAEMGEVSEKDTSFYLYTDQRGLHHRNRIIVSPESLKRLFPPPDSCGLIRGRAFDAIFLDEFLSLILHSDSKTLDGRRALLFSLLTRYMTDPATTVICMDAFISPEHIIEHREFRQEHLPGSDVLVLYNRYAPIKVRGKIEWVFNPKHLKTSMERLILTGGFIDEWMARNDAFNSLSLDEKETSERAPVKRQIIMCFGSRQHLEEIRASLLGNFPALASRDILVITSESGGDARVTTRNPEDIVTGWGVYPVILYTSSVQSGVNYYNKAYHDALERCDEAQIRRARLLDASIIHGTSVDTSQIDAEILECRHQMEKSRREIHVFVCCSPRSAEAEIMIQMAARSREFESWTIFIQQIGSRQSSSSLPVTREGIVNTFNQMAGIVHPLVTSDMMTLTRLPVKVLPGEDVDAASAREQREDYYTLRCNYGSLSSRWYYLRVLSRNLSENNYFVRCADLLSLWSDVVRECIINGDIARASDQIGTKEFQDQVSADTRIVSDDAAASGEQRQKEIMENVLSNRVFSYAGRSVPELVELLSPKNQNDLMKRSEEDVALCKVITSCRDMGIPEIPPHGHLVDLFKDWMSVAVPIYTDWIRMIRKFGVYNREMNSSAVLLMRQNDVIPENQLDNFYVCMCYQMAWWTGVLRKPGEPFGDIPAEFTRVVVPLSDAVSVMGGYQFDTASLYINRRHIFPFLVKYRTCIRVGLPRYCGDGDFPKFADTPDDVFYRYVSDGCVGECPVPVSQHIKEVVTFLIRRIFPCFGVFVAHGRDAKNEYKVSTRKINIKGPGNSDLRVNTRQYRVRKITFDIAMAEQCRAIRQLVEHHPGPDGTPVKATIEHAFHYPQIKNWKYSVLFFP